MKIKKPNICIIDDDRVYVNLISKIIQLRDLAQTIHIFKNGRDALNYFSSLKNVNAKIPDYVFLDVNMPIMDGWQFFEEYAKIDKAATFSNETLYRKFKCRSKRHHQSERTSRRKWLSFKTSSSS